MTEKKKEKKEKSTGFQNQAVLNLKMIHGRFGPCFQIIFRFYDYLEMKMIKHKQQNLDIARKQMKKTSTLWWDK